MKKKELFKDAGAYLENTFGPVDLMSAWMPFDYTRYYEKEIGSPLFRRVLVFRKLIEQTDLPDIKLKTNALEIKLSDGSPKRRINIDPGYMLLERFVLATGKNFTHRIYLSNGIYADLTLVYQKKAFQTLPWTYPDYADPIMLSFLERVRHKYCLDLKIVTRTPQNDPAHLEEL